MTAPFGCCKPTVDLDPRGLCLLFGRYPKTGIDTRRINRLIFFLSTGSFSCYPETCNRGAAPRARDLEAARSYEREYVGANVHRSMPSRCTGCSRLHEEA